MAEGNNFLQFTMTEKAISIHIKKKSIFVLQLLRAKTRRFDHGGPKPNTPFESTIQGLQKLTPWFSFYFNSFTVKNAFKVW